MSGDDRAGGDGRHPLPASDEARRDEIPEHLVREKGEGDDDSAPIQPSPKPVGPDGQSYGRAVEPEAAPSGTGLRH